MVSIWGRLKMKYNEIEVGREYEIRLSRLSRRDRKRNQFLSKLSKGVYRAKCQRLGENPPETFWVLQGGISTSCYEPGLKKLIGKNFTITDHTAVVRRVTSTQTKNISELAPREQKLKDELSRNKILLDKLTEAKHHLESLEKAFAQSNETLVRLRAFETDEDELAHVIASMIQAGAVVEDIKAILKKCDLFKIS